MRFLILLILAIPMMSFQSGHKVILTWNDSNPSGTTWNVYRGQDACSNSPAFVQIATGVAVKTYTDTAVPSGLNCYYVTAVYQSQESTRSNNADANVPPAALSMTVVVR